MTLYKSHPRVAGIKWWSRWEALWANVTMFDRAAATLRLVSVQELRLDTPALVEAAEFFALRIAETGVRSAPVK